MVIQQRYAMLSTVNQTGEQLDNKAATLVQAGGLIIALVGVVKIPDFVGSPTPWAIASIALAFLAFAGMVVCAQLAWTPSRSVLPGTQDWDFLSTNYLNEDVPGCFDQILSDLFEAIRTHRQRNDHKAWLVSLAAWLFMAQIVGVLALALVG